MQPNFLVVGAQKAGTTSLYHYLGEHPDIYLPKQKETKFFVRNEAYDKGLKFYEETFFSHWQGQPAVGEVDPEYMYVEKALMRLAENFDLQKIKLIFLLRNPVERAFSHYLMEFRRGVETLDFADALEAEEERIAKGDKENLAFSYVRRGWYLQQIERFLVYSYRKNMLFLLSEDLKNKPHQSLDLVFRFLGVNEGFRPKSIGQEYHRATWPRSVTLLRRMNQEGLDRRFVRWLVRSNRAKERLRRMISTLNQTTKVRAQLTEHMRIHLASLFHSENSRLAEFLGRDLTHWK